MIQVLIMKIITAEYYICHICFGSSSLTNELKIDYDKSRQ